MNSYKNEIVEKIIDDNLKWFNGYLYLPFIIAIISFFAGILTGIVYWRNTGYTEWLLYGIIIGVLGGIAVYALLKIAVSYRVLHILYLKDISENKGEFTDGIGDTEETFESSYERAKNLYYNYIPTGDYTYAVAAVSSDMPKDVVIPSEYAGKKVTAIASNAFRGYKKIVSVGISRLVIKIEDNAFSGCEGLKEIVYGGTVQEWKNIKKGSCWDNLTGDYRVYCLNGITDKEGNITG